MSPSRNVQAVTAGSITSIWKNLKSPKLRLWTFLKTLIIIISAPRLLRDYLIIGVTIPMTHRRKIKMFFRIFRARIKISSFWKNETIKKKIPNSPFKFLTVFETINYFIRGFVKIAQWFVVWVILYLKKALNRTRLRAEDVPFWSSISVVLGCEFGVSAFSHTGWGQKSSFV